MNSFELIAALALPDDALVDRRVPKTLLIENGAPTAGDRRRIQEGVAEIRWLAALKPTTVGVAEYRDAGREYLEIAVLQLTLRSGTRAARLIELVHRAVPYPVLLIARQGDTTELSLAHKRWSQGEAGKTVLDGDVVTADMGSGCAGRITTAFCESLAITRQPRACLHTSIRPGLMRCWRCAPPGLPAFSRSLLRRRRRRTARLPCWSTGGWNRGFRVERRWRQGKANDPVGGNQPGTQAPAGRPRRGARKTVDGENP